MRYIPLALIVSLSACGSGSKPPAAAAPSHAEPVAHESELLKLTLTPQAQQRLGIRTAKVSDGQAAATRQLAGEIVVPPSGPGGVPTNSTTNLQQIGAQQAAADGEVARASAQVRLARIALARAEALVREEAGSIRARDEAAAALATADAALGAAHAQRRLLGPSVASLNKQSLLWVRVSVFGSDLNGLNRSASAQVAALGDSAGQRSARPVQAIPSANATAGTVDLFYALPNGDHRFRVGQRVAVALPIQGDAKGLVLPAGAILRDIYGGEWVYKRTAENSFVRQRVAVASETNGQALLSRGLAQGDDIVTDGAAELFGTEFGAAH